MKKRFFSLFILCLFCTMLFAGCKNKTGNQEDNSSNPNYNAENYVAGKHYVRIEVADYGSIVLELDADAAPATVTNFLRLTEEGFYNGLTFHRIMEGFMMQGGDPEGSGMGGSEYKVPGEFAENGFENPISHVRGTVSMARISNNYNSASSQFFIMHQDYTGLDGHYAAFGKVLYGMDVVDTICTSVEVQDDDGTVLSSNQPVISSMILLTEEEFQAFEKQVKEEQMELPDPTAEINFIPINSIENLEVADTWNIDEDAQNYLLFSSSELLSIGIYEFDITSDTGYDANAPISFYSNLGANEYILVKLNVPASELPTLLLVAEEHSGAIGQHLIFHDANTDTAYLVPILN